ncbi:MAG: hypothetical protein AAGD04_04320 [Pseudomonadota bacterium]
MVRIADQPLLRIGSHSNIGNNINGPCVVRVPTWVREPLGKFYMYFAHHTGSYVRMAVADELKGPWHVLESPPLHLSQTGFAQSEVKHELAGKSLTEPAHIASPDVHVLDQERQFVMFYHGLHQDGSQTTRIAVSPDGLNFEARGCDTDLCAPYLRLCRVKDYYIGITWGGTLVCADSLWGPFYEALCLLERPNGPNLIPRHPALFWSNDRLHCVFSLIGDCPERLWHSFAETSGPVEDWIFSAPHVLLAPELDWEGAQAPKLPSQIGAAFELENALRDPFWFEDHIFYVGGGEQAIGVARAHWDEA